MQKIMPVMGTRPKAIKLAPVIKELVKYPQEFEVVAVATAQHRQMLDQVLELFKITPSYDLDLMENNQTLSSITARIIEKFDPIVRKEKPDWILIQGDTTTTFISALIGFYYKIRIGHIEAGLRTHNKYRPFPEEINRRLSFLNSKSTKLILVTPHRRENLGKPLRNICLALKEIIEYNHNVDIIYPVHLNPNFQQPVNQILRNIKGVHLISPLDYESFVWLMEKSYFILTDSGGIQEEAPSLGKPVLVLREVTERPEAVEAGTVRLVGLDKDKIVREAQRLLDDEILYEKVSKAVNPYGDGKASKRIVEILAGS